MKYKMGMGMKKKDKKEKMTPKSNKRMGMVYGGMEKKKRNAMNAGGMVAAAMEVQKAN